MRTQSQLKSNSELRREARCMLRMLVWARDNAQFDLGDSTLAKQIDIAVERICERHNLTIDDASESLAIKRA